MPKLVISFTFTDSVNPYVSDLGFNYSVSSRFNAPPDIDGIAAAAMVTAAGGIITNEPAVCSDNDAIKPRKLQFIRASGNTVSVAVDQRSNLLTAATAIRDILNNANSGTNPVVCIKLLGESTNNLNDELGVVYDGTTFAPTHKAPADAEKQNYVTGVISYEADGANPFGTSVLHPIRSITEKATNEFAAQLGTVPADCNIDLLTVLNCPAGRRNPRDHRRYKLDFATKLDPANVAETPATESIELPAPNVGQLDITACYTALAALPGLYCVGYMGENYDRFHKLLA